MTARPGTGRTRFGRRSSGGRSGERPALVVLALVLAFVLAFGLGLGGLGPGGLGPGRAWADPSTEGLPADASWPLAGPSARVLRWFDPPTSDYGAGHRGVDLSGEVGQPVLAAAAGTVSFAGRVGGVGVVTVDHGQVRTTYSPVAATVRVGTRVSPGQPIGTLQGGHCPELSAGQACLHWGLLRGSTYLDPLLLVPGEGGQARGYRLVPASEKAAVLARQRAAAASAAKARAAAGGSGAAMPTGGDWSSPGAKAAVAFAYAQVGKPYVFGAAGPNTFDCSGLTMRAWEAGGVEIGHYTGVQWGNVHHISISQLRPGDLVFWASDPSRPATIYHTAIYVGGDTIIQAPRPGKTVEVSGMHDWIVPQLFGRA